MRDVVRSTKRGLGPSKLKDGFDPLQLASVIGPGDDRPFDVRETSHLADVILLGCWFMLREIELAAASKHHLWIEGNEIHLLLPVHKTSTAGSLTTRVLRCACGSYMNKVCPWHCAERHLIRLAGHDRMINDTDTPLLPDSQGRTRSKHLFVQALRLVLQQAGIETQRPDAEGKMIDRFSGHSMRVSGALMLASAGTPIYLIQLLGRWSSSAVERYVQHAPLSVVPEIPHRVLHAEDPHPERPQHGGREAVTAPATPAVASLRAALAPPERSLVVRPRSSVVHIAVVDEQANVPQIWQTRCGWQYGLAKFYRVPSVVSPMRQCLKCFQNSSDPTAGIEHESSSEESDTSSSDRSASDRE